ncbi:MAG: mechanosensitive ion channel [Planctomycetes bacterium]|nr:mechanosensitive ion channel [Planctomycetota bacterium]
MKNLLCLLFLTLLAAQAPAQEPKPQLPPVDAKIETAELENQIKTLEKDQLPAFADAWWAEVQRLEKAVVEVGQRKVKAKGDEAKKLLDELQVKIEQRDLVVERLKIIQRELVAAGNQEKADAVGSKIKSLKAATDFADLTDVNELWTLGINWLKSPTGGIKLGMSILGFFVILVLARILSNIGATIVSKAIHTSRMKASNLLKDFFVNTTRKTIFFAGVIMALSKIGIDIGPLLAGIGVLGFVVGFALQGTLSNFACGIMILLYRPYDVGDVVSAAGATGKVTEMSLVSTTLTTPDNQVVIIPNSSIWGGVITNITGNDTRRVDMTFGIGYGDDIKKALEVLTRIVNGHDKVLKDPAPVIQLHELADSSVNFVVRPWSKTGDYWAVYWDVTRAVKEQFDAEGISIPFPQQDVHVHGLERLMKS